MNYEEAKKVFNDKISEVNFPRAGKLREEKKAFVKAANFSR